MKKKRACAVIVLLLSATILFSACTAEKEENPTETAPPGTSSESNEKLPNTTVVGTGVFALPITEETVITRGFTTNHFGIDFVSPAGVEIYAADDGVVVEAGEDDDEGLYVVVDHQNGYSTFYSHNSENKVDAGDVVTKGQLIALVGSTGNSTGNHLHFELRFEDEKIDPAPHLDITPASIDEKVK